LYAFGNELKVDVAEAVRNAGLALTSLQLAPHCKNLKDQMLVYDTALRASRRVLDMSPEDVQAGSFAARTLAQQPQRDAADTNRLQRFVDRSASRAAHGQLEPRFEKGEVLIALCEAQVATPEIATRAVSDGLNPMLWHPHRSGDLGEVFELNWYAQFLRAATDAGFRVHPDAVRSAAQRLVHWHHHAAQANTNYRVVTLEGLAALLPLVRNEGEVAYRESVGGAIKHLLLACLDPAVQQGGCAGALAFVHHPIARLDITGHFVSALVLLSLPSSFAPLED
jgi:hypothetical protein